MNEDGRSSSDSAPRRFGRFELQPHERVLLADGLPVALGARAFDLLVVFSDRPGSLITKDELLDTVWPGIVVEENNLQVQVSTLRKIVGQSAIATIPGRGYRFTLAVASGKAPASEMPAFAPNAGSDDTVAADASEATPSVATNLLSRLAPLYGRADDLAVIMALLRQHAVVTITGSGGIGKTRVAQAAAQRLMAEAAGAYPDGIWWVDLAAIADGELVPSAVAQAMAIRLESARPSIVALRTQLADRRALLVLDSCEHLAESVAAFVDSVTAAAPGIKILVTSQETLRAMDEHVYRLGGLPIPTETNTEAASTYGAVELFAARAKAVDPRFSLSAENAPAVIEICRRLDGIPLAIELAAARLPLLGVEGLRARLHERFNLLTGGSRVVMRRHQTLRATLEWSHALLTAEEQAVFRRLGVFAGGFTLEAAQHVASDERIDPWTTLDHLGALFDKSLVLAEGNPVPRYRMLETTRAYAVERLSEAGEMESILRRHAHAVLALLEPFELDEWRWRATGGAVAAAKAELDNLRAALDWASNARDASLAVALAGVSYSVWWSASLLAEGLARCLPLRHHLDAETSTSAAARFWLTLAKLGVYSTRRESYEAAVQAAIQYRELEDDQRCFEALTFAAVQGTRFATLAEMTDQIEAAARLERTDWPARQRAKLQFARCFWFARQGRFEEALGCAQRQVALCRDAGVEIGALYAMSNVTFIESLLGRPLDALQHARDAIARLHALGDDVGASHLYFSETIALLILDRIEEAFVAARNAYLRLAYEGDQYRMLLPLALINALRGRLDVAARVAGFDEAIHARTGENLSPVAPLLHRRLDPLLAAGLSDRERTRLGAEGAAMQDDEAFESAFAEMQARTD